VKADRTSFISLILVGTVLLGLVSPMAQRAAGAPGSSDPINGSGDQIQAVAKQAYIYGFPIVDLYRIEAAFFLFPRSPAFKAPLNKIYSEANVYTPADTTVQTPNSDTPYSFTLLDLRAEPYVLTLPAIQKDRYYSVQLVDQYTFNFAYLGSRVTGNDGGTFMVAGPEWNGTAPKGVKQVIKADTDFVLALYRTQLFGPSDMEAVRQIQAGYRVQPLSTFSGQSPPPPAPRVRWMLPLSASVPTSSEFNPLTWLKTKLMPPERTSPKFFDVLAFVLRFCPTRPTEVDLRKNFGRIGIVPGKRFSPGANADRYVAGMKDGQADIDAARAATQSANDLFGTPEQMDDNFMNRAVGAQLGILGNSAAEAVYLKYQTDSRGKQPVGSNHYTIHFAKDALPPVNAFWSITMYDLPKQLLVANPFDRYLINSPMLPQLKLDTDGGLTLYVQHDSPEKDKESNWLPAPSGPFMAIMRLYWPKEAILNGSWQQPPLIEQ
jgi:hypothetical protein